MELIRGFSKLKADDKIDRIIDQGLIREQDKQILQSFRHTDPTIADLISKFTENVITSYHLPMSIAPNFLINSKLYHVPMVVEESSVVAAASWSAKFWAEHGGFQTRVTGTEKIGQIHFSWSGSLKRLKNNRGPIEKAMLDSVSRITENMKTRGGGIKGFEWQNFEDHLPNVFQCQISFETADSMGANFINSCLEAMGKTLIDQINERFPDEAVPEIIMAILSNYTPNCLVECKVETQTRQFEKIRGVEDGTLFARKFKQAADIARIDPYRAVTHNKGIFNGMDGVILATANDFRAFEAGGHAFAARSGQYRSLSDCKVTGDHFSYTLKVPAALGTVGGLTATHPLAALALKILGNPDAEELMQIVASAGMANNFSAIKALTTMGIQSGHMKMHLSKILMQLNASKEEADSATQFFSGKTVSHREVADYLKNQRK